MFFGISFISVADASTIFGYNFLFPLTDRLRFDGNRYKSLF